MNSSQARGRSKVFTGETCFRTQRQPRPPSVHAVAPFLLRGEPAPDLAEVRFEASPELKIVCYADRPISRDRGLGSPIRRWSGAIRRRPVRLAIVADRPEAGDIYDDAMPADRLAERVAEEPAARQHMARDAVREADAEITRVRSAIPSITEAFRRRPDDDAADRIATACRSGAPTIIA